MRPLWIAALPVLAALTAAPAAGQVSARVHIDIPIGRQGPMVYTAPRRQVVVSEYDQYRFGDWDRYYDQWLPETVYYYDGYYYDYPIVPYAEAVLVYRFRDELFFAPRQREFVVWQQRFRDQDYRRDFGRQYRPAPRNDRDDQRYQPQRDDRNGRDIRPVQPQRDDRNGRDVRPVQPQRDDRNGRDVRPVQPQRDDRYARPAPAPSPARDAYRSRPRGGH